MSRRIVWRSLESSDSQAAVDSYFDRLLKYIPADVIGLWLAASPHIPEGEVGWQWLLFVIGLVICFIWMRKQTTEARMPTAWRQIFLSCGSFCVWIFAVGGPFAEMSFYKAWQGTILLIIYTTVIPYLSSPEQ